MAKYDLHGGGGAAQAAEEASARKTIQQMRVGFPPRSVEQTKASAEAPAEKTLPGYSHLSTDRLRMLAERLSAPGERIELISPSPEKVAATSAALREQTKQAEGALVSVLTANGESQEAAVAKARVSQAPIMAMFAGRWHTEGTGRALEQIQRVAKPAEVSVDALRASSQETPITWQGVKDAASFLKKCTKIGVGAYLGAGVVNMIGVDAALTVGKYYAMAVGVEAVYRLGQSIWNKKPVKGSLPGTEWAAHKLDSLLDSPRKTIGEALMKVGLLTSEAEKVAQRERTARVAELATAARKPEVVAQVQRLDAERAALVATPDQGVGPVPAPVEEPPIDRPDPLSVTLDLGRTPQLPVLDEMRTSTPPTDREEIVDRLSRTLDVPEDVIRGKMEKYRIAGDNVKSPETGTMYAGIESNMEDTMRDPVALERDQNFRKIAVGGVEAIYQVLPSMKKNADTLDKEFVLDADPDADKLSDHLGSIADEAVSLRLLAKGIVEREAITALDLHLPEDKEQFAARAGSEADYTHFDPEAWALGRLKSLGEDGSLVGVKNAKGEAVMQSESVKTFLKGLVNAVVNSQKFVTG